MVSACYQSHIHAYAAEAVLACAIRIIAVKRVTVTHNISCVARIPGPPGNAAVWRLDELHHGAACLSMHAMAYTELQAHTHHNHSMLLKLCLFVSHATSACCMSVSNYDSYHSAHSMCLI